MSEESAPRDGPMPVDRRTTGDHRTAVDGADLVGGSVPVERAVRHWRRRGEDGVATVAAAVLSVAVLAVLVVTLQLGSAVVARHRAEGAADLAALAAAGQLLGGSSDPCARAGWVVRNMHATLRACHIESKDVRVEVRASPSGFDFLFVDARAKAGPARR